MLFKKCTRITLLALSIFLIEGCGGGGSGNTSSTDVNTSEPTTINLDPTVNAPLSYSSNTNSAPLSLFSEQLLHGASDPENQTLTISDLKLRSGNDIGITISSDADPYHFIVDPYEYDHLLLLNDQSEVIYDYTISDGDGGSVDTSITFIFNGVRDGRRLDSLNFPDSKLQTCLNEKISLNSLTFVYELITIACHNIDSAQGIENLTALQSLQLFEGQLTSIDLSLNTALTYVDLNTNKLTSIDVYNNTKLRTLALRNNKLTHIDLSNNSQLTYVGLNNNQLSEIDVTNNTNLESLLVDENRLNNLDVSSNIQLTQLSARVNQLTTIDINLNNQLETINVYGNFLTAIDLSNNSILTYLDISHNNLMTLDVNANSALETLITNTNALTDVSLDNNVALNYLNLENNKITTLALGNNTALIEIKLTHNNLSSINLDNNNSLETLHIADNPLTQGTKDYLDAVKASGVVVIY